MPICVSCGTDNADGVRYCEECGVELGRATSPDTHPDEVIEDEAVPGAASATERAQQSPETGETRAAGDVPIPPEEERTSEGQPAERRSAEGPSPERSSTEDPPA